MINLLDPMLLFTAAMIIVLAWAWWDAYRKKPELCECDQPLFQEGHGKRPFNCPACGNWYTKEEAELIKARSERKTKEVD